MVVEFLGIISICSSASVRSIFLLLFILRDNLGKFQFMPPTCMIQCG